jgi:hypothetical protein
MPSPSHERVTITDALIYLHERTGYDFDRRTFQRWLEDGCVQIDEQRLEISCQKVGGLWYISRESLDEFVTFLLGGQTSQ